MLQLLHEDHSYIYSPLHIARYSSIQLNELWQRLVKQIAKASKRQQDGSNSGFHGWEPDVLPGMIACQFEGREGDTGGDSEESREEEEAAREVDKVIVY